MMVGFSDTGQDRIGNEGRGETELLEGRKPKRERTKGKKAEGRDESEQREKKGGT